MYKIYNYTGMVKCIRINRLQWARNVTRINDELQKEYSLLSQKGEKGLEDQRWEGWMVRMETAK
jgi:hypothetical protein